jgi:hypothetical protein
MADLAIEMWLSYRRNLDMSTTPLVECYAISSAIRL